MQIRISGDDRDEPMFFAKHAEVITLADGSEPVVSITHHDASWEIYAAPGAEPGPDPALVLEIRPGRATRMIGYWLAPVEWDWADDLAEGIRHISMADRGVRHRAHNQETIAGRQVALAQTLDLGRPTATITHHDTCWEVYVAPGAGPGLAWANVVEIREGDLPWQIAVWTAPITWGWGDFLAQAYFQISLAQRFDR